MNQEELEQLDPRDHRVLGRQLDLFTFSDDVGKGLPLWTARGAIIRRELERFVVDEEEKRGYKHVYTPDIGKIDLYRKSGHYPYYKDTMYAPIKIDDEEFMLRPMTCPHHFELYLSRPHSYRELPMRIAELAKLYRYELSGVLTGLIRVRSFCLADAHVICADKDQARSEIAKALELIEYMAGVFGMEQGKDYSYRLSLGDRKDKTKYFDDTQAWDESEQLLREVLKERKSKFVEAEAEAAFYGPKIDIQMTNIAGKEETAFTVQYDFVMPSRFKLRYTDENGKEVQPLVIHRSSVGAIERILAFLLERFGGALPVWLSPTQVQVLPVSEKSAAYASQVHQSLLESGIRSVLESGGESLGKRIREAESLKVPYIVVVGEKEVSAQTVSVRGHGQQDLGSLSLADFKAFVREKIDTKALS
jgi:threonyl-tRNA synthetase